MGRTAALKRSCVEFEWVNRYQRCSNPERSVIRLSGVLTGDLDCVTSRRVFLRQFYPKLLLRLDVSLKTADLRNGRLNGVCMARRCHL